MDQPAGTGFSLTLKDGYLKTMDDVTDEFIFFYKRFVTIFDEYENFDVWISGESFAGVFVPVIAVHTTNVMFII